MCLDLWFVLLVDMRESVQNTYSKCQDRKLDGIMEVNILLKVVMDVLAGEHTRT